MVQEREEISLEDMVIPKTKLEKLVLKGQAKIMDYGLTDDYIGIYQDRYYYKDQDAYKLICPWNYKVKK